MSTEYKDHFTRIEHYYQLAEASYRRWGQDPKRDSLYSLHFGFRDEENLLTDFNNSSAIAHLNKVITQKLELNKRMNVLDAGCGTGTLSYEIKSNYPDCQVVGINISQNQLETAASLRTDSIERPIFSKQNYQQTGFKDESFDRVVFCESFVHSPNKTSLLEEVYRILKPGGLLFMADYLPTIKENPNNPSWGELKTGWEIPYLIPIDEILVRLDNIGFINVLPENKTPRVIDSAKILGDSCRSKLTSIEPITEIARNNRLASVAFYDLLQSKSLGYYFISAKKNN